MKTKLLILSLIAITTLSFAQKAKIKNQSFSCVYNIYPEITGHENKETFSIHIKNTKNVTFTYSQGYSENDKKADVYNSKGISGFKWVKSNAKLFFDIVQKTSQEKEKELLKYQDAATKIKKFSYRISADQTYEVSVSEINAKNEKVLIKSFDVNVSASTDWPGKPSASVGYPSAQLLSDNFNKKQETVSGFYKKIDGKLIHNAIHRRIGKEIKSLIHEQKNKIIYVPSYVKTKDERFSRLDSAIIYLDLGSDQLKINNKEGIKGNHHIENARFYFLKAHNIYLEYSGDEYLEWFTKPELKEQYNFEMASNLYLSSFLCSDHATANNVYNRIKNKASSEVTGELQLKRTPAQKSMDKISSLLQKQEREEKFEQEFKKRYGY